MSDHARPTSSLPRRSPEAAGELLRRAAGVGHRSRQARRRRRPPRQRPAARAPRRRAPRRRGPVRGERRRPRPPRRRPGLDHRPARRHPRVHRAARGPTGPCTSACGSRATSSAGAVALPAQGIVLCSSPAPALPPVHGGPLRLVVSRTRPPAITQAVADRLGAELVPMGSAGAKATSVVLGTSDVYLHAGGQWEWDSAAPVAVCRAAGLHTSRLDGTPARLQPARSPSCPTSSSAAPSWPMPCWRPWPQP